MPSSNITFVGVLRDATTWTLVLLLWLVTCSIWPNVFNRILITFFEHKCFRLYPFPSTFAKNCSRRINCFSKRETMAMSFFFYLPRIRFSMFAYVTHRNFSAAGWSQDRGSRITWNYYASKTDGCHESQTEISERSMTTRVWHYP